ncbi:MAG: hypothetical protein PWQ88_437 [Candidatus Methanomethylophilaceae archaeon]|nr:hypothetical protein [Candidatus Methanomethylophilaceae archaeon]MDI3541166.1 hypothetical protein [Candidatus Methanomethylophilaceae archaeon]
MPSGCGLVMREELERCITALFRLKGREAMGEKEFVFSTSIDLRWFRPSDAQHLLDICISEGILKIEGGYLRPTFDMSQVDIPLAFRPSPDLIKTAAKSNATEKKDLFHRLISMAIDAGMERRSFVAECNRLQDRLGVEIEIAGMLVLKDNGVDVMPVINEATSLVVSR